MKESAKCYLPKRFIVTFLGCLAYFNAYALRVNLSVALVAMVNDTTHLSSNDSFSVSECPQENEEKIQSDIQHSKGIRYDWDSTTQGYIMSSFFYAYFITVFMGGYLAERFGAARISGAGMFMSAILTLLTPTAVNWGLAPFLAIRALQGIALGSFFPAMTALVSRWSPKLERSRMSSIVTSGYILGIVVTLAVSGWLCSSDFLGGWPSVFYVSGTFACIWFLLWTIFVYETPYTHPHITKQELLLFEEDTYIQRKKGMVPWKSIITSLPVWAMLFANIGGAYMEIFLSSELPTYFTTALHFNIKTVGFLTALPYILKCISTWIGSYAADRLRKSGKLSITSIRKIFNSIAGYGIALCLIGVAVSGCNLSLILVLLCIGMSIDAMKMSGFNVISIDMCPDFAGTVYGLTNGVSNLIGVIAPTMTGMLTASGPTIANWSKVFYIIAAVTASTSTFFALFASAELQPWGKATYLDKHELKKITESRVEVVDN